MNLFQKLSKFLNFEYILVFLILIQNCFRFYHPINNIEGVQIDFSNLADWMNLKSITDYENLLKRFRKFPDLVGQICGILKLAVQENRTNHNCTMVGKIFIQDLSLINPTGNEIITHSKDIICIKIEIFIYNSVYSSWSVGHTPVRPKKDFILGTICGFTSRVWCWNMLQIASKCWKRDSQKHSTSNEKTCLISDQRVYASYKTRDWN